MTSMLMLMTSKLFTTKIRKPRQRQWWQPCCRPASTTPTPSTSASRASSSAAPVIRTSSVLSSFYSLFQSCHHFVLLFSPVIILSSIMVLFSHCRSEHIHFFHPSTEFPIVHNHLQQIFSILFVLWFRFTSFCVSGCHMITSPPLHHFWWTVVSISTDLRSSCFPKPLHSHHLCHGFISIYWSHQ